MIDNGNDDNNGDRNGSLNSSKTHEQMMSFNNTRALH